MIKYKEMLVTLNKEVKKLDRIHRAVRKTTNEFTSISMECFLDNYSYLIEADESWYKPKAERNREGKIELTPEYNFSLANRHRGYFEWDLLQPWSPKYVKEDVGTYRGHRPVTITRGVTETRADFVFIYTKKHLLNYQLIHAFNNMILGKRRKWLEEDVGYPEGRYDEVDRDLKTELDLMNDTISYSLPRGDMTRKMDSRLKLLTCGMWKQVRQKISALLILITPKTPKSL